MVVLRYYYYFIYRLFEFDDANATNISLAPNPSNGNATLHFNDANHTYTTLTVYNALGSLIQ
ncbi:MAG: hypothetical protein IPL74_08155 [Bacteroidetes bacterium]|nr:hypothetical protein [Bacteroidota bacterium]